ncbi:helix-turn-helix domain-containing protein [Mycobacterium sp. pUA109]|uniref:helix-turn-helix domain-containing protein n=1 Tax=Mycobacterium sp. pUA109 TaxID=3238982 RepID=UPI00351AF170
MARNWKDVRAEVIKSGRITEAGIAKARRRAEVIDHAYKLSEVRKTLGFFRQVDVAEVLGVSQARVSKLESGDLNHIEIGTLQAYIEALGGSLAITAVFGDERLELGDFRGLSNPKDTDSLTADLT